MKVKQAIITAAGFGSRFLPAVKNIPKEMLPVVNKPTLEYVVDECLEAGMEKVIIVVRKGNDIIKDHFTKPADDIKLLMEQQGKMDRFAAIERILNLKNIHIVEQNPDLPYGNGSPVLSAKHLLTENEPFAALFADDLVLTNGKGAMTQLSEFFEQQTEAEGVIGVQLVPESEANKYGMLKIKELGEKFGIAEFLVEKPALGTQPSNLASYGRFIIPWRIFDFLKSDAIGQDGEVWLQDANAKLMEGGKMYYREIEGEWMTTGDPLRFFKAQLKFILANPDYSEDVKTFLKQITQDL